MIGFLVHDERLFSSRGAVGACHALRTYRYQHTEQMGPLRIHFFRNASLNNYIVRDDRCTTCVAGTLIFDNVHGTKALNNLREALCSGKGLADLFKECRGPYTLIHIDRTAGQVSILNSREGLRNCFQAARSDFRAYSTNLLLLAALIGASSCAESVRQFIHIGAILEEKTIFENVNPISAASLHTYRNEQWTVSRLWRLRTSAPDRDQTRQDAIKKVTESFVRNFGFTLSIRSGRVAVDLTAGTDSRTVLCCLMETCAKPVASTQGDKDFVDVRIARKLADKLGIEHYWYGTESAQVTDERVARAVELADGNQDPMGLVKLLPYYDEKAHRFDIITGGGGGPLFKDHYWLFEFNRVSRKREPNWNRIANLSLVHHAISDDFFSGFSNRIMDHLSALLSRRSAVVRGTNNQKLDFVYFDLKVPVFGGQAFSLTTQFMDVFHPMLDGDNVQYSINLSPEIRIRNILQFGMIQRLRPELCWIPTDTGVPTIPPVGLNSWLRILRGKRYLQAGLRKIRTAILGSSGEGTDKSIIEEIQSLGYFDLLDHSSLAVSSIISAAKLAEFKNSPRKQPNLHYLTATIAIQLFFERVKELMNAAREVERGGSRIATV